MDLVEAYFDESYGDGSPFLCLGGYIFSKESAIAADAEWQRMLTDYFYFVRFAAADLLRHLI